MAPVVNNVFSGPDALKDYYNPERNPPLPLVEVPEALNPFYQDGVRIYAKMMTFLPAHNVKELPALNMLQSEMVTPQTKTVVEYSSGSTVISMGLVARILHGITDTRAYISNKTSPSKLRLLQFFGLDLRLFGGPSQPEPLDERGGIQRARVDAENDKTFVNLNQYENNRNWGAHYRWTGPQILTQLPSLSIMCAGMGTAGTLTGIATYLKEAKPSVATVGVCTAPGDRVPGPRSHALLAPVEFPWKVCVDTIVECGSKDAFTKSLELTRWGIVCGPSSGFNLIGLSKYLQKRKDEGTFEQLRGENGLIDCAFICCDLPYQYIDEYFHHVDSKEFHPIKNNNLVKVDTYRYDDAWELEIGGSQLNEIFQHGTPTLIDLRRDSAVELEAVPKVTETTQVPLQTLSASQGSPFFESTLLEAQWQELAQHFDRKTSGTQLDSLSGKEVLVVCHGGDTARVATSILRANGVTAWSIKGGAQAWAKHEEDSEQRIDSPMRSGSFVSA